MLCPLQTGCKYRQFLYHRLEMYRLTNTRITEKPKAEKITKIQFCGKTL